MEIILGTVAAFATSLMKRYGVIDRFSPLAIYIAIFLVAVIASVIWHIAQNDERVMATLLTAGQILISAVGMYEVILKRIGMKKLEA